MTTWLSPKQYAEHRGISPPAITKHLKRGSIPKSATKPVKKGSKRILINVEAADKFLSENTDSITSGGGKKLTGEINPDQVKKRKPKSTDPKVVESLNEAKRIKEVYVGKIKKLEYEISEGKWINAKIAEDYIFKLFRRFRDSMLNIPNRLSAELAGLNDEDDVSDLLSKEINIALEDESKIEFPS